MDMADQLNERAGAGAGGSIMFNVNWNSLLLFSAAALSGGSQFSSRAEREFCSHSAAWYILIYIIHRDRPALRPPRPEGGREEMLTL